MASHLNPGDEPLDGDAEDADLDRIDVHLLSALDTHADEDARYHLREALQLQVAEMSGTY